MRTTNVTAVCVCTGTSQAFVATHLPSARRSAEAGSFIAWRAGCIQGGEGGGNGGRGRGRWREGERTEKTKRGREEWEAGREGGGDGEGRAFAEAAPTPGGSPSRRQVTPSLSGRARARVHKRSGGAALPLGRGDHPQSYRSTMMRSISSALMSTCFDSAILAARAAAESSAP